MRERILRACHPLKGRVPRSQAMALQCSQLCLPTSLRCDLTPRKVPLFRRLQCANTLQNSNIAIQVRFSRHCKKDLTRNVRQWRRRNVCVRAVRKDPKPTYVEMIPIKGEDQFNEVLGSGSPVIIDWSISLPFSYSISSISLYDFLPGCGSGHKF